MRYKTDGFYQVPRASSGAPFLIGWSMWLGALFVLLVLGVGGSRPSPAEVAFDDWADGQQRPANWRKCHDDAPLAGGMVRCEAGFGGGRVLVYCPGDSSSEQTCRWL
jgi:hypothetical protein